MSGVEWPLAEDLPSIQGKIIKVLEDGPTVIAFHNGETHSTISWTDLETGKQRIHTQKLGDHGGYMGSRFDTGPISQAVVIPSSQRVLCAHQRGTLIEHDPSDATNTTPNFPNFRRHRDHYLYQIDVSPESGRVALSWIDGLVEILKLENGTLNYNKSFAVVATIGKYCSDLCFSSDGLRLAYVSGQIARVADAINGKPLGENLNHHGEVRGVMFNPSGSKLITWTAGQDSPCEVYVWKTTSGSVGELRLPHPGKAGSVQFSPDSKRMMSSACESDSTAHYTIATHYSWALDDLTCGTKQTPSSSSLSPEVVVSPDGKYAFTLLAPNKSIQFRSIDDASLLSVLSPDGAPSHTTYDQIVIASWLSDLKHVALKIPNPQGYSRLEVWNWRDSVRLWSSADNTAGNLKFDLRGDRVAILALQGEATEVHVLDFLTGESVCKTFRISASKKPVAIHFLPIENQAIVWEELRSLPDRFGRSVQHRLRKFNLQDGLEVCTLFEELVTTIIPESAINLSVYDSELAATLILFRNSSELFNLSNWQVVSLQDAPASGPG